MRLILNLHDGSVLSRSVNHLGKIKVLNDQHPRSRRQSSYRSDRPFGALRTSGFPVSSSTAQAPMSSVPTLLTQPSVSDGPVSACGSGEGIRAHGQRVLSNID